MVRPRRRVAREALVAGLGAGGGLLPGLAIAAGRDHGAGLTGRDGGVTGSGVVGSVGRDQADDLLGRDLRQEFGQHGAITDPAAVRRLSRTGGVRLLTLDGADLHRLGIDAQMDLAPRPGPGGAVLAGAPLALASGLDAGAVDEQVQGAGARAVGNLDAQALLAPAERAEVRHGPVQLGQLQEARHQSRRLPQSKAEQRLQRQASLNCSVREGRRTTAAASRHRQPLHLRVKPDQQ